MGCSCSTPRNGGNSSPYDANIDGDASSHAMTSNAPQLPNQSSPHATSQRPPISERNRARRHLPLGEQFNLPLRPHVWTANRQWTRRDLDKERQDFFDTRVTGHTEIWSSLRRVVELLGEGDVSTAQSILDAAAITVPTGDLKNGAYDQAGNLYQMPDHVISDPTNILPDEDIKGGDVLNDVTDDEEELGRKREEKGKGLPIKVKARLSDRGGPDVVITIGNDQNVKSLIRRLEEEANTPKIRIAYMGKILKESETLQAQGWLEGHVVNALVFGP